MKLSADELIACVQAPPPGGLVEAVESLYAELDAAQIGRQSSCAACGRCCQFGRYDHDLFVTTVELAVFAHRAGRVLSEQGGLAALPAGDDWRSGPGRRCPFQRGPDCGVRGVRPLGCRLFFCDPRAAGQTDNDYELHHRRLKEFGERYSLPYAYVEWTAALSALIGRDLLI